MTDTAELKHSLEVPSGTVTFLFTDIEGSTKLLERLREDYAVLLEDHHRLLRAVFARWNGIEIGNQGDSFFVAFPRAIEAIHCVVEAQRMLSEHAWPQGVAVKVRMGLHSGEPIIAPTGYIGMDIHRAARIASSGHGGQVLISQATRELTYQDLPPDILMKDLGEYRLKDIRLPQRIYQLVMEGLPDEFPGLMTLSVEKAPPTPGEPPYMGLHYFDESNAKWFFGRQQVSARLAEVVQKQRFLAVIGASGSGKSSVVRAGLVPILKQTQPECWSVHIITPTAHPLEALSVNLTRASESVTITARLMDDLKSEPRTFHLFVERSTKFPGEMKVLLIVDQFEELFTLCRDEIERQAFVDNLMNAVEAQDGSITVLITLRADFYEHLARYKRLREWVSKCQEYIGAMTAAELRQTIKEPAKNGGWELSPGLVDLMLHDIGASGDRTPEPGALPLLSHALLETWKRRRANLMNLSAYTEAGGVRGAIAHTAESIFYQELSPEQQSIARHIFLRLTELGEGTQDTRRRATIEELLPAASNGDLEQVEHVLVKLADARLITTEKDTVEVAHEALIREWPTLRNWLAEDREGLRMQRALSNAAAEWKAAHQDPSFLLTGARLEQFENWSKVTTIGLAADEAAYLQASLDQRQRRKAEEQARSMRESTLERRSRRFLRSLVVVFALAAVTAILLSAYALRQSRLATSRELAAAAISNLDVDPERSILLALQALQTEPLEEAQNALHQALNASHFRDAVKGHEGEVVGLSVSPNGRQMASLGWDGTLMIWEIKGTQIENSPVLTMTLIIDNSFRDYSTPLAFSPDGTHLATFGNDHTVVILDTSNWKIVQTLSGHLASLTGLTFSPEGKRLATTSADGTARIWELSSGRQLFEFHENGGLMLVAAFSPDGKWLATGGIDAVVRLWQLEGSSTIQAGTNLAELDTAPDELAVFALAFNPDGSRLAAGGNINHWIWDLEGLDLGNLPELILTIPNKVELPKNLYFSHDGQWFLIVNTSGSTTIWDASSGQMLLELFPNQQLSSSALSLDGITLFTGHQNGKIASWNVATLGVGEWAQMPGKFSWFHPKDQLILSEVELNPGEGVSEFTWWAIGENGLRKLSTYTTELGAFVFREATNHDLSRHAFLMEDGIIKIFDASNGHLVNTYRKSSIVRFINLMRLNQDGSRLMTTDFEGHARIFETDSGKLISSVDTGAGNGAMHASISPDGRYLSTVTEERGAILWDAVTGQEIRQLKVHTVKWVASVFTPDNKRILSISQDGVLAAWDVETGREVSTISGISEFPLFVTASHNGKLVAVGYPNQRTSLIDLKSGQELLSLPGWRISFSPDDQKFLLGSTHEEMTYGYTLDLEDLIELAQARVTRSLTEVECQKYLHRRTCPAEQ